jgi:hypothetical protein
VCAGAGAPRMGFRKKPLIEENEENPIYLLSSQNVEHCFAGRRTFCWIFR